MAGELTLMPSSIYTLLEANDRWSPKYREITAQRLIRNAHHVGGGGRNQVHFSLQAGYNQHTTEY
jgi:hypothetical protein